ncbi:DgyrCDS13154 [Dimorphilus gyrociliatus]|uniref:DgyrCDS13154 n=1 Tax=Dimorphilus gyrociliatus TaxID=2664684 RepID=A0A7I8W9U4_9ANNE|nr:DgyrCDS13154 [Dimorphilus gyrociliatus]
MLGATFCFLFLILICNTSTELNSDRKSTVVEWFQDAFDVLERRIDILEQRIGNLDRLEERMENMRLSIGRLDRISDTLMRFKTSNERRLRPRSINVKKKLSKRRRKSSGSKKRLDAVDAQLRQIRLDLTNHTKILNSHEFELSEIENLIKQNGNNIELDEKLAGIGRLDRITDKMEMDISKILYDINTCKSNFTKLYHNVSKIELNLPSKAQFTLMERNIQNNKEAIELKSQNIDSNTLKLDAVLDTLESGLSLKSTVPPIVQPKPTEKSDRNAKTERQIQVPDQGGISETVESSCRVDKIDHRKNLASYIWAQAGSFQKDAKSEDSTVYTFRSNKNVFLHAYQNESALSKQRRRILKLMARKYHLPFKCSDMNKKKVGFNEKITIIKKKVEDEGRNEIDEIYKMAPAKDRKIFFYLVLFI